MNVYASSGPGVATPGERGAIREVAGYWWLWLVTGIFWVAAALVILQFDQASVKTVGIIVGLMFAFAAVQQFTLMVMADRLRWLWGIFGVLFAVSAIICFVNPKDTFHGIADILGFLFLTVGVWWTIQAFIEKEANPVWWLGLLSGVLMIILAFWTSGQFFLARSYALMVFAGIWALMQGVTDIIRAFQVRSIHEAL